MPNLPADLHRDDFDRAAAILDALTLTLARSENGRIALRVPPGSGPDVTRDRGQTHCHPWPEMFLQLAGGCRFTLPKAQVDLAAGEVLIMPPWEPHAERTTRPETFCNLVVATGTTSMFVHLAYAGADGAPRVQGSHSLRFLPPGRTRAQDLLADVAASARGERGEARRQAYFNAFLALCCEAVAVGAQADEPALVAQARAIVRLRYLEPELTAGTLAQHCGVTPDHLARMMRRHGLPGPSEFINATRLEAAKRMLEDTGRGIGEVAAACGYRDPGYLARRFRRRFGDSPRRHRQRSRG